MANWRKLSSTPVEIVLEDVRLVMSTRSDWNMESQRNFQRAMAEKLSKLASLEEKRFAVTDVSSAATLVANDSMAEKIIHNIQVKLLNFHFRYESPHGPALGVSFSELSALTTNRQWRPEFQNNSAVLCKLVQLRDFNLYIQPIVPEPIDSSAQTPQSPPTSNPSKGVLFAVNNAMTVGISGVDTRHHVLQSLNATLQVTIDKLDTSPMVQVTTEVPVLKLSMSHLQLHAVRSVAEALSVVMDHHRELFSDAKAKFFREATGDESSQYMLLYKKTLNASWLPELTDAEKKFKAVLEDELTFMSLARLRALAIAELKHELNGLPVSLRQKPSLAKAKTQMSSFLGKLSGKTKNGPPSAFQAPPCHPNHRIHLHVPGAERGRQVGSVQKRRFPGKGGAKFCQVIHASLERMPL